MPTRYHLLFICLTSQNQTIRDNIIGHSNLDRVLYREVVKACDLEKDLDQLAQGDSTVIGSKGLALSGGQKQRVVSHVFFEYSIIC